MAVTYTLIESYTVGSGGVSSVTLGSGGTIPNTYTDLKVVASIRGNRSNVYDWLIITFNGSTSGFSNRNLYGNGSSAASDLSGNNIEQLYITANSSTSNTFSNTEFYIPNYTSSNYKTLSADSVSEYNGTTAYAGFVAGLWSDTSAITSIKIEPYFTSNMKEFSTFYLYGIKNS